MITASALPRLFACAASGVLPREDYRTTYADDGHARHAEQERAIEAGDMTVMPDEIRELLEGLDVRAEAAMAYDVVTGEARIIGYGIGRAYSDMGPFEVAGSCDVLAVGQGRIVIVDWKGHAFVAHPSRNEQLLCYALMAARIYGIHEVTVAVAHITDGNSKIITATIDAFGLDEFAMRLRDLFAKVARAASAPAEHAHEGKHCAHCPSFMAGCPRKRELVALVDTGAADVMAQALIPLGDDESASLAYEFAQRLRMLLKRVDASIYARAAERPIPIGGGKMLGLTEKLGNEVVSGPVAYACVRERYGQTIADASVEMETSKKRLREALGFAVAKGGIAAAERAVLDEIRAKGGTSRRLKTEVGEYVPQLNLVGGAS